jgi:hypothetical protein
MRPAFLFIARKIGIKGSNLNIFREASAGVSKNGNSRNNDLTATSASIGVRSGAAKGRRDSFYRLPDNSKSGAEDGSKLSVDEDLRPQHGYRHTKAALYPSRIRKLPVFFSGTELQHAQREISLDKLGTPASTRSSLFLKGKLPWIAWVRVRNGKDCG